MSDQGPEPLVLFLSLLLYLGFELSFCSMDFPEDITLRKTRMKFELTFKVVLLFSYQGLLPCESFYILSHHFLFVKNFLKTFFIFFLKIFVLCDANFYMLSHVVQSVKKFFNFLLRFLSFFFQKCVSHVQRIL